MKKNTEQALKYLVEFLIVAFGVFLGLYTSDWHSQKKLNREKAKSIRYILDEMEMNKKNLSNTIQYHEIIKESFDSISVTLSHEDILAPYLTNKNFNHQQIKGWSGLGLANFEDIAFEGAKLSGIIQEMDIETIQIISKVYKHQKFITEIGNSTLNRMIDLNFSSKTIDVLKILELLTSDFLNSEKHLYSKYVEAIDKIKKSAYLSTGE